MGQTKNKICLIFFRSCLSRKQQAIDFLLPFLVFSRVLHTSGHTPVAPVAFYFAAAELNKTATKTRVAILLHCAGAEAQDIYSNFVFANNDHDRDTNWEYVLKKFRDYCDPRKKKYLKDINSGNVINARGRLLISG